MVHGNRKAEQKEILAQGAFGLLDGLNGGVATAIGLLVAGAPAHLVAVALLSRAAGSSISMGGSEYETDETSPTRRIRVLRVAAMMIGYLTSAVIPSIGYFYSKSWGVGWSIPAVVICLGVVVWVRSRQHSLKNAVAITALIFSLSVAAGLAAGAV